MIQISQTTPPIARTQGNRVHPNLYSKPNFSEQMEEGLTLEERSVHEVHEHPKAVNDRTVGQKKRLGRKVYIITLSGMLGSGKSTVAKLLAEKLGYSYYSVGSAQRELATERGISTLEMNHLADVDPSVDIELDGKFKKLANTGKNYVVDARLAFHFIPSSFKVKLNVDMAVAGERVLNDEKRTGEKKYASVAEAVNGLKTRRASEVKRFQAKYGVNLDDDTNYDLVVDTTHMTIEDVVNEVAVQATIFFTKN